MPCGNDWAAQIATQFPVTSSPSRTWRVFLPAGTPTRVRRGRKLTIGTIRRGSSRSIGRASLKRHHRGRLENASMKRNIRCRFTIHDGIEGPVTNRLFSAYTGPQACRQRHLASIYRYSRQNESIGNRRIQTRIPGMSVTARKVCQRFCSIDISCRSSTDLVEIGRCSASGNTTSPRRCRAGLAAIRDFTADLPVQVGVPVIDGSTGVVPRGPIVVVREAIMAVQLTTVESGSVVIGVRVSGHDELTTVRIMVQVR